MIYVRSEPTGDSYRAFISFVAGYCDSFELVLRRKGLAPSARASAVISALAPFELRRAEATQWSSTQLGKGAGTALLARYRLTEDALAVLQREEGLYRWRLPELPEDLSFFTADGSCFLSSCAHERQAMLRSGKVSSEQFEKANPAVKFTWYPGHRT